MKEHQEGFLGRWCCHGLLPWILIGLLTVSSAGAWPAGVDHTIFSDGAGPIEDMPSIRLEGSEPEKPEDTPKAVRTSRILGVSLLGSGLFLCSWGITSWEVEEYQCCPAHNTGNVVKIVAGIVLLNAGLIYLMEGDT